MENYTLFGSWESCPLLAGHQWVNVKANKNLLKICPIERKLKYVCKNGSQYLFLENNYLTELKKWCSENENNSAFFQKHLRNFHTKAELVKRKIDTITRVKPPKLTDEELAVVYNKVVEQINEITPFDQFGMITESIFVEKLSKIISKDAIAAATMPPWSSTTVKEELAVVNAALESITNPSAIDKGTVHLAEHYGYIPVFCFNQSWNEEHYENEISEKAKLGREKLEQRKTELENFEKTTREKITAATAGINSPLPEMLQVLSFTRNEAELVLSYGNWKMQSFYKEICKRLSISAAQLIFYTQEELTSAIIQRKANAEMLNKRSTSAIGIYTDCHSERLLEEKEINELMKNAAVKSGATQQPMCACPGNATGKIRIVRNADDILNFQQGEILVAKWTCVDFLPAMKKAAAFITEGGGITSHASVIARELNVPCVIGYKNATTAFKNGDVVEVNAEQLKVVKVN
ncbi:MAG: PEP-utilizing enzyme [Candidatus Micrarchaeota archaeon]